jgi:excisionase family DNA binding protein
MGKDFYTSREVAAMLGASPRMVREWVARGYLPSVRMGPSGQLRIPREGLKAAIELKAGRTTTTT